MNARGGALPLAIAAVLLATPLRAEAPPNATYTKRCASCHGEDGRGSAKKATVLKVEAQLLDFTRPEAAALDAAELRKVVEEGKGKMPAYGTKLTPAEIDALVAHVLTLRQGAK